ncbi:DUF6890 family protein [Edaphovirga cremea]|uniref:DUF6890 family protein n=1 Tax=Edaphovirga cremea TaxID=2267246 RepID=UPI003988A22A
MEQYLTLRRHYLPHESDDALSMARALWLAEYFYKRGANSVTAGVNQAFGGEQVV